MARSAGSSRGDVPAPVVSLTESTQAGQHHLIGDRGYEPWGIVFRKTTVFAWGGGPAWYVRHAQWHVLDPDLRHSAVLTEPGRADWLHEREWRVPATGRPAAVRFTLADVHAVIVGNFAWPGGPADGDGGFTEPAWAADLTRWYWNRNDSACGR